MHVNLSLSLSPSLSLSLSLSPSRSLVSVVDPSYAGGTLQIGTKRKYEDMMAVSEISTVRTIIISWMCIHIIYLCMCVG